MGSLDRESYYLRRRTRKALGVCHAPWVHVHRSANGTLRPCRFTDEQYGTSAKEVWGGETQRELQEKFAKDEVDETRCSHCVEWWNDQVHEASPAMAEFDRHDLSQGPLEAPRSLSIEWNGPLTDEELAVFQEWLPALESCEITFEELPDANDPWLRALQERRQQSKGSDSPFREHWRYCGVLPAASDLPESLDTVVVIHPMITAEPGAHFRDGLLPIGEVLDSRDTKLGLRVPLDRDNWIHIPGWMGLAKEVGAKLLPQLTPGSSSNSLAALGADSLSAIHATLVSWLAPDAPATKATEEILARLRAWQNRSTESSDTNEEFALPRLDHPLWQDEHAALQLLAGMLRVYHSPRLQAWFESLASEDSFVERAREHRGLRVAALWLVAGFEQRDRATLLGDIFESRGNARRVVQEDRKALESTPLHESFVAWSDTLHLPDLEEREEQFPRATAREAGSEDPQLTVVIPSFQHEAFIQQAIESVLGQTLSAFRLLVVDDGSNDRTVEIAKSISDPRLQVEQNPKNLGLGASFARALGSVKTPLVAILNSDDMFHPERLEKCVAELDQHPNVNLVATRLTCIDREGRVCTTADSSPAFDGYQVHDWLSWFENHCPSAVKPEDLTAQLLEGNFLVTSSNLLGRTAFFRAQEEAFVHQEFCLDWQLFLNAARNEGLRQIEEPLLGYRLHGGNTVWWDEDREWRYYVESNQVVARALQHLLEDRKADPKRRAQTLLEVVADHLRRNSDVDGAAVLLGLFLEKLGLSSRDLRPQAMSERLQALHRTAAEGRRGRELLQELGGELGEFYRLRGEQPFLHRVRNQHEALADRVTRTLADWKGVVQDRAAAERLWHEAEAERDREIQDKAALYQQIGELQGVAEAARFEEGERLRERDEARRERDESRQECDIYREEKERSAQERDEARAELADTHSTLKEAHRLLRTAQDTLKAKEGEIKSKEVEINSLEIERSQAKDEIRELRTTLTRRVEEMEAKISQVRDEREALRRSLDERTWERDRLQNSAEFRSGHLLLNKLRMRAPLSFLERSGQRLRRWLTRRRLAMHSRGLPFGRKAGKRAMATACWNFPIYSQTFVYQELTQLVGHDFDLRFVYSKLDPRDYLHDQFAHLWDAKRELILHKDLNRKDYEYYQKRMPEKVEALTKLVSEAAGMEPEDLRHHDNFWQAFSYTRMVEAFRPDYLHSYFFYDRSFMSLVAGFMLDIPRGVSCYADHVMDDYELKLVPLHLKLCDIVIATSARIKRELLEIGPGTDPDKILVKPNAINADKFPVIERPDPEPGQPFRLVCINRIEPKKGLTYLVDAMAILRDKKFPVELHLVGEADHGIQSSLDYNQQLLEKIEALDLWGTVHLEGRQDEQGVRRFLGMSHVFMAPFVETTTGDKDGIPTALLEAMSTGIPTIATDAGSMLEVIDDKQEGLIVAQCDGEALAAAIEGLLEDSKGRQRMGEKAAKKAREKFDVKVCESIFHRRLDQVLERRAKGSAGGA